MNKVTTKCKIDGGELKLENILHGIFGNTNIYVCVSCHVAYILLKKGE